MDDSVVGWKFQHDMTHDDDNDDDDNDERQHRRTLTSKRSTKHDSRSCSVHRQHLRFSFDSFGRPRDYPRQEESEMNRRSVRRSTWEIEGGEGGREVKRPAKEENRNEGKRTLAKDNISQINLKKKKSPLPPKKFNRKGISFYLIQ